MDLKNKKIYVAGSGGMVGSVVVRRLQSIGCTDLITRSSAELDLRTQSDVDAFFDREKPEAVIIAAAKVGGILANDRYRADFIYDNLMIEANVINAAFNSGVEKLILLGSSCIYPKLAPQPIREEQLLTGLLESTNEPYAIAKIAGIKLCESYYRQHGCNFYSIMPTNLYGPNDNFDLETSHVIPALLRKFHDAATTGAREVTLWGTGTPKREFLYVDDLADALVFLMERIDAANIYEQGITHINVGTGLDISIRELAEKIAELVGFDGEIRFDPGMADGTPRKLLDIARLDALGWKYKYSLDEGLKLALDWYVRSLSEEERTTAANK